MDEDVLEEMAKQQFILGVTNSITRDRLIVKRQGNLKNAIEFARLSELAEQTTRGYSPPANKNVFVAMPFPSSNNSRTSTNFESAGSRNFSCNTLYYQINVHENFKNYNARFSLGRKQP